jgi:hypothetical protein
MPRERRCTYSTARAVRAPMLEDTDTTFTRRMAGGTPGSYHDGEFRGKANPRGRGRHRLTKAHGQEKVNGCQ